MRSFLSRGGCGFFVPLILQAAQAAGGGATVQEDVQAHVRVLAGDIGPRAVGVGDSLARAAAYIEKQLAQSGRVTRQEFKAAGAVCANVELELRGRKRPEEIVVIGAHYDTVPTTPGADDNASGVAALLVLAREFARGEPPERTVRFVAFANEEPAYFQTELMGSRVYARRCKQRRENVVAMVSLESIGYFSAASGTQDYPTAEAQLKYPAQGNFLAFVGDEASRDLVQLASAAFKVASKVPVESAALPAGVPGVGWSDHWSFWQDGYRAFMITDTAPYRNPHYHRRSDKPETLDYPKLADAVGGFGAMIRALGTAGE